MSSQIPSKPARAAGATIAVSLANAASENHSAAAHARSSRYEQSPQKTSPAAAKSSSASELCAKKTGYIAVHSVDAIATFVFAARSASRKTPSSENAAIVNMAARVT